MATRSRRYEEEQEALNPHRAEERARADAESRDRLADRGVELTGQETSPELADILSAVELFEATVIARGGDPMVDNLTSSEPTDPAFVLPRRAGGEAPAAYIERIREAISCLRERPAR
jgi:hypothetical protein